MDNDRAFKGRLSDQTAYPFAAIVVLALAGIIGVGLATSEGVEVDPPSPLASRATASTIATTKPKIPVAPTLPPSLFHGLIGLPPEGAEPSAPETGELVETFAAAGGAPPYRGTARLYADGRLIWNRYYGSQNSQTTGYLEQRLTPEGVEIVKEETDLAKKDPMELLDWLPLDVWQRWAPMPYVPSGYGICVHAQVPPLDQAPDGVALETAQLITMLPASLSDLLQAREFVSPIDWDEDCVAQSLEEARVLDRVLREAGYDQEPFINRFTVQYWVDVPDAYGMQISLVFEPRFPDGSIGCSACG